MTKNRLYSHAWTLLAATAFSVGALTMFIAVEGEAGSANAWPTSNDAPKLTALTLAAPPGPAAFGVDEGAFYSDESLFIPLAMTRLSQESARKLGFDLMTAQDAAVVFDALNVALAETGHKTYQRYAAAVAEGRQAPNASVERARRAAAKLSARDCMNLRRALDHLALTGGAKAERDLMKSGMRADPWGKAAKTVSRTVGEAL